MVTNAGVLRDRVLWKMTDEDFDLVIATHLRGTFTCARAAAIAMREQGEGGRIIVVGSPAGQRGNFGQTNYAAAKAGIAAFARTWAMELARSAITVNAVIPTAWTAMTASIPAYAPLVERVARGEGLPAAVRQRARRRDAGGLRRARRLPGLGCRGRRHRPVHRHRRRPPQPLVPPRRGSPSSCARAAGAPSRSPSAGRSAFAADAAELTESSSPTLDLDAPPAAP